MKIEVGKTYWTRDREYKVEIVAQDKTDDGYDFTGVVCGNWNTWKHDGSFVEEEDEDNWDIVEEFVEPLKTEFECVWGAMAGGAFYYPDSRMNRELIKPFLGKKTKVTIEEIV